MNRNSRRNELIENLKTLVTQCTLTKTSPSNHTNIYKAKVKTVSLGDKLPPSLVTSMRVNFHSYIERILRVDRIHVENILTFGTID